MNKIRHDIRNAILDYRNDKTVQLKQEILTVNTAINYSCCPLAKTFPFAISFYYSPIIFILKIPSWTILVYAFSRNIEAWEPSFGHSFYKSGATTENAHVKAAADLTHLQGGTFRRLHSVTAALTVWHISRDGLLEMAVLVCEGVGGDSISNLTQEIIGNQWNL